jgi:hypothetical protein
LAAGQSPRQVFKMRSCKQDWYYVGTVIKVASSNMLPAFIFENVLDVEVLGHKVLLESIKWMSIMFED